MEGSNRLAWTSHVESFRAPTHNLWLPFLDSERSCRLVPGFTPLYSVSAFYSCSSFSINLKVELKRGAIVNRSFRTVLVTTGVAVVTLAALYSWLSPAERYKDTPWLPQVVITLVGLVGASWFAYRRLEILDEGNTHRKHAAAEQLVATERGNLNSAIKEADSMMAAKSLSSIIAGQRWLHHLAEDDSLDSELIRSLLCAYIVSSNPASVPHEADTDSARVANETRQARQSALEMIFGSPGKERYSQCQNIPELGSCKWHYLNFTNLDFAKANFRNGDFTNAKISGTCFEKCDLRETEWNGSVGGPSSTNMRYAKMCGLHASSCTFENIDFSEADMRNNGLSTRFISCIFKNCDFTGTNWTGAILDTPTFEGCTGLIYDHLRDVTLYDPSGLPKDLLEKLREMKLLKSRT